MADRPMTVRAGSSAMVAMVHGETTGGVVYLYDPISDRGDERFAFKAVRLDNPTDDTLEPGPVTVYGDGRFIGEGITEPVPPKASVVVPFALDKQVVVDARRPRGRSDREARHRRSAAIDHRRGPAPPADAVHGHEPAHASRRTVYLRHRLESRLDARRGAVDVHEGRRLAAVRGRPRAGRDQVRDDRRGDAGRSARSSSRTDEALGMMKVYVDEPRRRRSSRSRSRRCSRPTRRRRSRSTRSRRCATSSPSTGRAPASCTRSSSR